MAQLGPNLLQYGYSGGGCGDRTPPGALWMDVAMVVPSRLHLLADFRS